MTEHAPIRAPKRSDYEPIVRGLRPMCEGEELVLRSSLLLMRDRAIATKPNACEASWALLDVVEREASSVALHHEIDVESLRIFRRLCIECVITASGFDTIYQPSLPGIDKGSAA